EEEKEKESSPAAIAAGDGTTVRGEEEKRGKGGGVSAGRLWSEGEGEWRLVYDIGGAVVRLERENEEGSEVWLLGYAGFTEEAAAARGVPASAFCGFPAMKVRREVGEQERLRREGEEDGEGRRLEGKGK
ncbi:hypothetical protein HAX54_029465, partial [Datura stramonium]|nr:hypothetical protein [Datura stramonium]